MSDTSSRGARQSRSARILLSLKKFAWEHPAVLLTLGYLYLCLLGVIYLRSLLQQFSLNIMDFVETSDFLLAAFKNPGALSLLLYCVFYALLMGGLAYLEPHMGTRGSDPTWQFILRGTAALFLVTGAVFSVLVPANEASNDACKIRLGQAQRVGVELTGSGNEQMQSCLDGQLFLVARTDKFAFFYDLDQNYTHVIPIANILHIHVLPRDSTWACPTATPPSSTAATPRPSAPRAA